VLGLRRRLVRLAEPPPRWAALFAEEAERLAVALAAALEPLGCRHAPGGVPVPGHEVFGKGDPRTHLLHAVVLDSEPWRRPLAFRDALRADPALAAEYAALKRELAARFPGDRASYTAGKGAFVERVVG
jgi:GrpB-like predicted nucleotidyltransferase (UPF0157 family)